MKQLTVLGATGSIGRQTLDIVAAHYQDYAITALTANSDVDTLLSQCLQFKPQFAVVVDEQAAQQLRTALQGQATEVLSGAPALAEVASLDAVDIVVAGIMGAAGLLPTLAAVNAGKRVLLANKEPLVMAGQTFIQAAKRSGAELMPVDSEHNAIFQCLPSDSLVGQPAAGVSRLIVTASGGALRDHPLAELSDVTPQQACAHPNWSMGDKITIDSATMLNKGFEVIEAHHLFAMPADKIDVLIHPQSIVHALVEYDDGSVLAHLGHHDMRIPIAHALAWPARISSGAKRLNLLELAELQFKPLDHQRYPCFQLALDALAVGGSMPAILNAANEEAVAAFLQQKIGYTVIYMILNEVLSRMTAQNTDDLDSILAVDKETRSFTQKIIIQNT